jgi:hypothetical protein
LDRWFPKPKSEEKKDEAPKPAQDNNPNTAAALAMYKEMTGKGKQKFAMDILGISQEQLRQIKNGTKEVQKDKKSENKSTSTSKEVDDRSLIHRTLATVVSDAYLPRKDMVAGLGEKSAESLRTIIKENARGNLNSSSELAKVMFAALLLYENSSRK